MFKKILVSFIFLLTIGSLTNKEIKKINGENFSNTYQSVIKNYHSHDMQSYFYFNNDNFGNNITYNSSEYGSCTAVASLLLLSYYDTFYNDYIIPEKYDVNGNITDPYKQVSPGIIHDIYPNFSEVDEMIKEKSEKLRYVNGLLKTIYSKKI